MCVEGELSSALIKYSCTACGVVPLPAVLDERFQRRRIVGERRQAVRNLAVQLRGPPV